MAFMEHKGQCPGSPLQDMLLCRTSIRNEKLDTRNTTKRTHNTDARSSARKADDFLPFARPNRTHNARHRLHPRYSTVRSLTEDKA